jgi:hypothetical protein
MFLIQARVPSPKGALHVGGDGVWGLRELELRPQHRHLLPVQQTDHKSKALSIL